MRTLRNRSPTTWRIATVIALAGTGCGLFGSEETGFLVISYSSSPSYSIGLLRVAVGVNGTSRLEDVRFNDYGWQYLTDTIPIPPNLEIPIRATLLAAPGDTLATLTITIEVPTDHRGEIWVEPRANFNPVIPCGPPPARAPIRGTKVPPDTLYVATRVRHPVLQPPVC